MKARNYLNHSIHHADTNEMRILDVRGEAIVKYVNDFMGPDFGDGTAIAGWTCTMTSDGAGTTAISAADQSGGGILITTAAGEYDGINAQLLSEAYQLTTSRAAWFEITAKQSEATQKDFLAGLCITDTTLMNADTSHATALSDGVYFECLDGGTGISFVTEKNSSETQTDSVGTMDTAEHRYGFYFDGPNGSVYAFIDGVLVATHTLTIPDDELLTPSFAYLNGSAAAGTLTVGRVAAWQIG